MIFSRTLNGADMARDLFGEKPKRRARRVMMHVADAGCFPDGRNAINFVCERCGHDNDWTAFSGSISAAKRGEPCPKCNPGHAA
jgi:hypothetical protein